MVGIVHAGRWGGVQRVEDYISLPLIEMTSLMFTGRSNVRCRYCVAKENYMRGFGLEDGLRLRYRKVG